MSLSSQLRRTVKRACTETKALRSFFVQPSQARTITASSGVALGQAMDLDAGTERIPELPAKTLGRLLAQPGALGEKAFAVALDCALLRIADMDGKDCVRVLRALMQVRTRPEDRTLQQLGARLGDRLSDVSLADMADLVDNLANARLQNVSIFARLSVAFSLRMTGATASQLTKVAVGFSKARLSDRRLFPRLAQCALPQLHVFPTPELPAFLSAFATVGMCHEPLLVASYKVIIRSAYRFSALDLALVAFSYAQFHLVFPPLVTMLQKRLPSCAHELPPVRLAELAVSCARLNISDPVLLSTFIDGIKLPGLSPALFGQVLKSISSLGLSGSSGLQDSIVGECHKRLAGGVVLGDPTAATNFGLEGNKWILDIVDALGEAADQARKLSGGTLPRFLADALLLAVAPLMELCLVLDGRQLADLCRSLRQLPPSLVSPDNNTTLFSLHASIADRAAHLATAEAFSFAELTSTHYSLLCLYPQLWLQSDVQAELSNPHWKALRSAWDTIGKAWDDEVLAAARVDDLDTTRQMHVLQMLRPRSSRPVPALASQARHRPIAIEILEILECLGHDAQGPTQEGALEIHAASGSVAFIVLSEDEHFRRQGSLETFEERSAVDIRSEQDHHTSIAAAWNNKYELCSESAMGLQLLQLQGWQVVALKFFEWRKLDTSARRDFVRRCVEDTK